MMTSRRLTIFEGPDGSGKSTAAKLYAKRTRARYVHFPALPHVDKNLGRMYVEAMLPALLGYQDVVFDRCWLSELPYGIAFRHGQDRLGDTSCLMLERLAMRCGAVVVWCDPGWHLVRESFLKRHESELLKDESQLQIVYDIYSDQGSVLPGLEYDYTECGTIDSNLIEEIDNLRMPLHPLTFNTAGNLNGKTVIVGENFAEPKDCDSFYQWPFASFDKRGCSHWLTEQIFLHTNTGEDEILWMNSDMDLSLIHELNPHIVIALGMKAQTELYKHKIMASTVAHPEHYRRFHSSETYQLLDFL